MDVHPPPLALRKLLTIAGAATAPHLSSTYRLYDTSELRRVRAGGTRRINSAEIGRFTTNYAEAASHSDTV